MQQPLLFLTFFSQLLIVVLSLLANFVFHADKSHFHDVPTPTDDGRDAAARGPSSRTQQRYLNAVRQLAEYNRKPPDQIEQEELRRYFLLVNLLDKKQLSPSSCRVAHYAIRFLYVKTLGQAWPANLVVRPQQETKLPVVLIRNEVHYTCLEPLSLWPATIALGSI